MLEALSRYVKSLEHGASATGRAEDRPIYMVLLADAAGLLASHNAPSELATRIASHERLRGHSWLRDDVRGESDQAWAQVILAARTKT